MARPPSSSGNRRHELQDLRAPEQLLRRHRREPVIAQHGRGRPPDQPPCQGTDPPLHDRLVGRGDRDPGRGRQQEGTGVEVREQRGRAEVVGGGTLGRHDRAQEASPGIPGGREDGPDAARGAALRDRQASAAHAPLEASRQVGRQPEHRRCRDLVHPARSLPERTGKRARRAERDLVAGLGGGVGDGEPAGETAKGPSHGREQRDQNAHFILLGRRSPDPATRRWRRRGPTGPPEVNCTADGRRSLLTTGCQCQSGWICQAGSSTGTRSHPAAFMTNASG